MKKIILASTSRDRKKAFLKAGIPFEIIGSDYEEDNSKDLSPEMLVQFLAKGKMNSVKQKIDNDKEFSKMREQSYIIIAADTIVAFNGKVIGKSKDKEDAFKILKLLCGKTHELITGVSIFDSENKIDEQFYDKTSVQFNALTDIEIWDYLNNSDEYVGRAGAYSLQDRASFFIEKIEGSPSNVIGIPINLIYQKLKKFGVNLMKIKMD